MSGTDKNCIVGIDLGTTYSCVSVWKDGAPVVIPSKSGRTMPSWVSFSGNHAANRQKLVGAAAKAQAADNPSNTIYDVKRILGRSYHDPVVQDEKKNLPYSIVEGKNGEPKIVVCNQNKELSPEEVSAMILGELKLAAEEFLGHSVSEAVITGKLCFVHVCLIVFWVFYRSALSTVLVVAHLRLFKKNSPGSFQQSPTSSYQNCWTHCRTHC